MHLHANHLLKSLLHLIFRRLLNPKQIWKPTWISLTQLLQIGDFWTRFKTKCWNTFLCSPWIVELYLTKWLFPILLIYSDVNYFFNFIRYYHAYMWAETSKAFSQRGTEICMHVKIRSSGLKSNYLHDIDIVWRSILYFLTGCEICFHKWSWMISFLMNYLVLWFLMRFRQLRLWELSGHGFLIFVSH